jgi:hypothetical protein
VDVPSLSAPKAGSYIPSGRLNLTHAPQNIFRTLFEPICAVPDIVHVLQIPPVIGSIQPALGTAVFILRHGPRGFQALILNEMHDFDVPDGQLRHYAGRSQIRLCVLGRIESWRGIGNHQLRLTQYAMRMQ